ncbi:MAG TPA: STAS domain-containing protein [Paludibacteraceae bacterium]|nr:STAS domain-containing protein [Paludibacteraceae bacterium]HQF49770.1 STAS domain-containing protein [Paludibacteraceae bacterium]HQJ90006.1 STAS domain-containing protein [Paludibacteraceae bacterium]
MMKLIVKEENGRIIGTLEGRLDTAAGPGFMKEMEPLLKNADKQIILDCAALEYISSYCLRAFLALRKASAAKGGKIQIINMNDKIIKVFKITGFYKLFDIKND